MPFGRSYDAQEGVRARFLFTENPRTTSGIYRWYGYRNPISITSDSITLCETSDNYAWFYLFPAVARLIQAFKDGDFLSAHPDIEMIAKKYAKEKNKGEQGEDSDAEDHGF